MITRFLALLAVAAALPGCGASQLATQADTVAAAGHVAHAADKTLVAIRAAELDAIVAEATRVCASGCSVDVQETYRDRLAAREAHWEPIMACREPLPPALRAYVDGLELASIADERGLDAADVISAVPNAAELYEDFRGCVSALDPNISLPPLPGAIS